MSERMLAARVHVGTESGHPAAISGESSPMDASTVVERIAAKLTASAGLVAYDTENRTTEATQTTQL
ncbi:hypothetical protein [Halorubrum aidingense]|uniref:hypothetical protein n=1 Tax=Halorubrum aidingense TaxID=368623 RepID=UPI0012676572|nr:hypothetical protein [Halorubrum aidingense]